MLFCTISLTFIIRELGFTKCLDKGCRTKIKCVHSIVNVNMLASTCFPFRLTTVQLQNLSLTWHETDNNGPTLSPYQNPHNLWTTNTGSTSASRSFYFNGIRNDRLSPGLIYMKFVFYLGFLINFCTATCVLVYNSLKIINVSADELIAFNRSIGWALEFP